MAPQSARGAGAHVAPQSARERAREAAEARSQRARTVPTPAPRALHQFAQSARIPGTPLRPVSTMNFGEKPPADIEA